MAFEKEIKEAQKICDEWMKRSQRDHDFFMGMKKNGVAWEKDATKTIETFIKKGEVGQALSYVKDGRNWLADYTQQCTAIYDKHYEFTRGAPRKGAQGICAAIGLDTKHPGYKTVYDAMAKELIKQTKQFKETENLWTEDLKVKIDVLLSKLDTLEKLASGAEKEMSAYGKQFAKDKEAFFNQMSKAMVALKVNMAELAITSITKDPKAWVGGIAKARNDQYNVLKERADQVSKMMDLATKNYGRIVKSVPQEVRDKFMFAKGLKDFEARFKKLVIEMKEAQGKFKMAVAVIEKNYPDIE